MATGSQDKAASTAEAEEPKVSESPKHTGSEEEDQEEDEDDEDDEDEGEVVEEATISKTDSNLAGANTHTTDPSRHDGTTDAPPLPEEAIPPLPSEDAPPLPEEPVPAQDDGWAPVWEPTAQAFYFYNRFTGASQWTNPRVPEEPAQPGPPGVDNIPAVPAPVVAKRPAGGYDPAIHGDYDPNAWYAQPDEPEPVEHVPGTDTKELYAATGAFNRFTGRWQAAEITPENYNDDNKSKRQMNAFFDVDDAANSHDGRSLKAERSGKKLSKTELKQFKEKRKAKKEEKRRAWLRD